MPIEKVWSRVRDFNALPSWHPAIADSKIEGDLRADRIGCVRHFHTKDGGLIRERLLMLSDIQHSCTYTILESPMGVDIATLELTPVTDGKRTFAEWRAEFDCPPGRKQELGELIGSGVGRFDNLKTLC